MRMSALTQQPPSRNMLRQLSTACSRTSYSPLCVHGPCHKHAVSTSGITHVAACHSQLQTVGRLHTLNAMEPLRSNIPAMWPHSGATSCSYPMRRSSTVAAAAGAAPAAAGAVVAAVGPSKLFAVLLGYIVLVGSCFRSVPQIMKILQSKSVEGERQAQ